MPAEDRARRRSPDDSDSATASFFAAAAARSCSREGVLEEWEGASGGGGSSRSGGGLLSLPEVRTILSEAEACGFDQSEINQLVMSGSCARQRPALFAELHLNGDEASA